MPSQRIVWIAGLALATALALVSCANVGGWIVPDKANTLYVATDGSDDNPGTRAKPFATLQRARDEIRTRKAATGLPDGATVVVLRGTYLLPEPLVLGPEDSGTEAGPITYTAARGARVAIKGSRPIAGWKPLRDAIWQADLSGVTLGESRFWQLFYNGKRQTLARTPNFDPKHPRSGGFAYLPTTLAKDGLKPMPYRPWGVRGKASQVTMAYNPERIDPGKWAKPDETRVHVWSWLNWNRNICRVKAVDTTRHTITLASRASYPLMEGNRFFVENVAEELDTPGEWHYDTKTHRLTFWPPDGQCPEGNVSVPVMYGLIKLHGDAAKKQFVRHVHLRGFDLGETHHTLVELRAAAHCSVVACTLTNCGSLALSISDASHHNEVRGCDIARCGGPAITLSGRRDWSHSLEGKIAHNLITNNHVHHVGEGGQAWGAIRINPGCGGNCTHDNVVSHNLVHDTPRQGISFNGFRNIVEFNHVHHTNQEQSDTGAIGMGSRDIYERGSIIRHNYIHDTGGYCMVRPGVWKYPHYCWGVYLDDYTSGVHVYGNLIVRAFRAGVMIHGGQDNVVENNIIVDSELNQIEYAPIDSLTSGRTPGHPDTGEWLMTGTRCLRNICVTRHEKAGWLRGKKWKQVVAESDHNVLWHTGGQPIAVNLKGVARDESWAAWRKLGFDAHLLVADPMFVDPERGDYRLRTGSPALKLGFKPIPFRKIGLYKSPDRASWPVADDCWREEHLIYPEGKPAAPKPRTRKSIPKLPAIRVKTPPTLDGKAAAPEWDWAERGAVATVAELSMGLGNGKQPSRARVAYDDKALYIALVNRVSDTSKLPRTGGTWGEHDGAEICIQDVSAKRPGPVFVVQGYPSGKCESVANADAPTDAVRRLGKAVRYAASIGKGTWTGEWCIPFAALGIDAARHPRIRFNIGVRKAAEGEWIAWVSTGGAPWKLARAGELVLK